MWPPSRPWWTAKQGRKSRSPKEDQTLGWEGEMLGRKATKPWDGGVWALTRDPLLSFPCGAPGCQGNKGALCSWQGWMAGSWGQETTSDWAVFRGLGLLRFLLLQWADPPSDPALPLSSSPMFFKRSRGYCRAGGRLIFSRCKILHGSNKICAHWRQPKDGPHVSSGMLFCAHKD